jgi:hypothetical protein
VDQQLMIRDVKILWRLPMMLDYDVAASQSNFTRRLLAYIIFPRHQGIFANYKCSPGTRCICWDRWRCLEDSHGERDEWNHNSTTFRQQHYTCF